LRLDIHIYTENKVGGLILPDGVAATERLYKLDKGGLKKVSNDWK